MVKILPKFSPKLQKEFVINNAEKSSMSYLAPSSFCFSLPAFFSRKRRRKKMNGEIVVELVIITYNYILYVNVNVHVLIIIFSLFKFFPAFLLRKISLSRQIPKSLKKELQF